MKITILITLFLGAIYWAIIFLQSTSTKDNDYPTDFIDGLAKITNLALFILHGLAIMFCFILFRF